MSVATAVVGDLGEAAGRILATHDMAAESRGAAALDRVHYLVLLATDVTPVGITPSGAVIAEDVRDLQLRP